MTSVILTIYLIVAGMLLAFLISWYQDDDQLGPGVFLIPFFWPIVIVIYSLYFITDLIRFLKIGKYEKLSNK